MGFPRVSAISEVAEADSLPRAAGTATTQRMRLWAGLVIVGCVFVGWVAHIPFVIDAIGGGAAAFIRRQSEAPALVGLIVLLWAIFAADGYPREGAPETTRRPTNAPAWGAWFGVLLFLSVLTTTWDGAPNAFVTLKESFFAVIVVSLYLGWSCGFWPQVTAWRSGAPVKAIESRLLYYGAVLAVTVLSVTSIPGAILGDGAGVYLRENSEGYIAALFIPLYFDVVAGKRPLLVRVAWYGVLAAIPLLVQLNPFPSSFEPVVSWFGETTEAFIATIVISAFFDLFARFATSFEKAAA